MMTETSKSQQSSSKPSSNKPVISRAESFVWIEWVGLIVAGCLLILFRLHAFDLPLENDECNYAYIGGRLLQGDQLYVDVWDHQPPGIFILFSAVISLFGDAPEVFRWLAVGSSLASMFFIYVILRIMAGLAPAMMGVFLFAVVSSDPGTAGEGCNREIFMNTLILAGWYFALRSSSNRKWMLFFSGASLALASLIKTIVAVHWLLLAIWILIVSLKAPSDQKPVRVALKSVLWLAVGPFVLWLTTFVYFGLTGRFNEFIDAVFLFNLGYSEGNEGFLSHFFTFFTPLRHPFIFDSALPLWIGGGIAFIWLIFQIVQKKDLISLVVFLFVLGSYVAVCLPGHSWPHYYYLMIPPMVISVSLFVNWIVCSLVNILNYWSTNNTSIIAQAPDKSGFHFTRGSDLLDVSMIHSRYTFLLYVIMPVLVSIYQYNHYLNQPLFGITVHRYNSRDFWGRAQGENIKRITHPDDTIFVYSNDTSIYYYAHRRCASRYTMITGISSGMSGIQERRNILMKELRENMPRLIVVLYDQEPFPEWKSFLHEHYDEPIGWDFHDRTHKPIMFVVSRKDQPVESINWDWDRSSVGGWQLGEVD